MPKLAPPPPVAPETWRALLDATANFAALKPWEHIFDSDVVGLIDPITAETRIGSVLGNAGEVFAAVFYRRAGVRWILQMLQDTPDLGDFNNVDSMDTLKIEFVPKHELWKEDLAMLRAADFKPQGKGHVWPQFRSMEGGWHPWHINQAEAEQLLADLPRLTAFCKLFEKNPDLFDDRAPTEIPFLPSPLPERPLGPDDLDWRPLLPPPATGLDPFEPSAADVEKLSALKREPGGEFEFDSSPLPGGSFIENGRPCFGRFSLLVESKIGIILGAEFQSAALTPGEAAGRGLVKALQMGGRLPGTILIGGTRLQPVLQPICDALQIRLMPVSSLPALDEAIHSLSEQMLAQR